MDGKIANNLWSHVANLSRQIPMSNIKQVEVLYGPASAIYGPIAFLVIINIITLSGKDLEDDGLKTNATLSYGSFNTMNLDASLRGKKEDLYYNLSAKYFSSDEADLSWYGFNSNETYSDKGIWGPILNLKNNGESLNKYYDPTKDFGIDSSIGYKNSKIGIQHYNIDEGYGANYPADRAQNNSSWLRKVTQVYFENSLKLTDKIENNLLVLYKNHFRGGEWIEATLDWDSPQATQDSSYVSFTNWASRNQPIFIQNNIDYKVNDNLNI